MTFTPTSPLPNRVDKLEPPILTAVVRGASGRKRFARRVRPADLQQRVDREPLGVLGRVLVFGSAVIDGGGLFTEHFVVA